MSKLAGPHRGRQARYRSSCSFLHQTLLTTPTYWAESKVSPLLTQLGCRPDVTTVHRDRPWLRQSQANVDAGERRLIRGPPL